MSTSELKKEPFQAELLIYCFVLMGYDISKFDQPKAIKCMVDSQDWEIKIERWHEAIHKVTVVKGSNQPRYYLLNDYLLRWAVETEFYSLSDFNYQLGLGVGRSIETTTTTHKVVTMEGSSEEARSKHKIKTWLIGPEGFASEYTA